MQCTLTYLHPLSFESFIITFRGKIDAIEVKTTGTTYSISVYTQFQIFTIYFNLLVCHVLPI
jgi:hypothetical protein